MIRTLLTTMIFAVMSISPAQAQTYEMVGINSGMSDAQLLDRIETKGKLICLQYPALGSEVDYHCLAQGDLSNYYSAKKKANLATNQFSWLLE